MSDVEAINRLLEQYIEACNAGDYDAYVGTLDDNVVWMPPDVPTITGKKEVGAWVKEEFFNPFHIKFGANFESVEVFGSKAFAPGTFSLDMTPKSGGETIKIIGKFMNAFRKQADGSWKYARAIYNFDKPVG